MEGLINNLSNIECLKALVKNKDSKYFKYTLINDNATDNSTISIVMTSANRSKQVYYTLSTIQASSIKNIQVILVDDSSGDPVQIEELRNFSFRIDFIQINRNTKCWYNPCINYNIGFQYINGGKVVIQNSEVCHVGDVLKYVNDNVTQECEYHVFDVVCTKSLEHNDKLYERGVHITTAIFNEDLFERWYQHHQHRNYKYHFLTACDANTFKRIGGFSYDYAFDYSFDDDDLVFKIRTLGIDFRCISSRDTGVAGIHLYHHFVEPNIGFKIPNHPNVAMSSNYVLSLKKIHHFNSTGKYLEVSSGVSLPEIIKNYILLDGAISDEKCKELLKSDSRFS